MQSELQTQNKQNTEYKSSHTTLLGIAVPLILANITTPLLGLVDTAILGRMDGLHYLAGAAIGSLILTQLYWVCGFIKMSMTGLSAQSRANSAQAQCQTLVQGAVLALLLAALILILQSPFLNAGLWFAQAETQVVQSTEAYFYVRVWGAPAALVNLAIIGWLIGQQKGRLILLLQVLVNLINIGASLGFVFLLDMGVQGVAAGTVVAEYTMLCISLYWINKRYVSLQLNRAWFSFKALKSLLSLNSNMLIRNLALQFTLAFVTLKGAQYGTQAAAINAILMQFFALIALGLDGIANAVEALVGEVKGKQDSAHAAAQADKNNSPHNNAHDDIVSIQKSQLRSQVNLGMFWSGMVALLYALIFYLGAQFIISLLTNQSVLVSATMDYFWLIVLLPLIAHWCFLFDGVYVGLTQGHVMRNNMLVSAFCVFLPSYFVLKYLLPDLGNEALWIAMLLFLASRGFGLGGHFYYSVVRLSTTNLK